MHGLVLPGVTQKRRLARYPVAPLVMPVTDTDARVASVWLFPA
jgi:hypothetical protein